MASNTRIFYATHSVGIKPDGDSGNFDVLRGVQSAGMTTNFNLTQLFQLGAISIYQNVEDIPDVQVTLNKVLDGYPPIYLVATQGTTTTAPTLAGRSVSKSIVGVGIYPDTNTNTVGLASTNVTMSGMFVSSIAYSFQVDGAATEDVSLVGNDRLWSLDPKVSAFNGGAPPRSFTGVLTDNENPQAVGGVSLRQHVIFDTALTGANASGDGNGYLADPNCTVLPNCILGISSSGLNLQSGGARLVHVQSINFSTDLGREAINELGQKAPYTRYPNFPVQVTTEITVVSSSGDFISATQVGIFTTGTNCGGDLGNLEHSTIRLATCEGTRIYTGIKNKLQSVNYTGGDTGGGNVNVTYSFVTYNDLTVMHEYDPHASGTAWWAIRDQFLCTA